MTTFYYIAFFLVAYFAASYIAYLIGKIHGEEKSTKVAKDYYENLLHAETEEAFTKGYDKGRNEGYNDGKREAEIVAHNEKILRKKGILK
jgi:hypothetical protein